MRGGRKRFPYFREREIEHVSRIGAGGGADELAAIQDKDAGADISRGVEIIRDVDGDELILMNHAGQPGATAGGHGFIGFSQNPGVISSALFDCIDTDFRSFQG
jgi:hypothetical protein